MRRPRGIVRLLALMVVLAIAACSGDDGGGVSSPGGNETTTTNSPTTQPAEPTGTTAARTGEPLGVGFLRDTFVDRTRPTPRSGDQPATDERVLESLVFYPTAGDPEDGAVEDTQPAPGPYPLIVFSHGLGGTPELSQPLIERWVSAGFVVVAPRFPLSRPDNPAGPDAGDVKNQTGDVSFLIDAALEASSDPQSPLAGLIDGERIGASGHSNGAITTIGVTLHTCCADDRIDAAIEFAGTASPFDGGEYDWSLAPPYLIVHGTEDSLVSYGGGVALYNDLVGPKGILTLDGGGHSSMFDRNAEWFDEVDGATTDFFRAYLGDDDVALARLEATGGAAVYPDLRFDPGGGDVDLIPTTTVPGVDREVTVEPTTGLVDGQTVTVTWSGFTPDGVINVVQCSKASSGANFCDLTAGRILFPNPTGSGSLELAIVVGPVGDGTCGPQIDECVLAINDSGLTEPEATVYVPLQFAA